MAWAPDESRLLVNILDELWLIDIGPDASISTALGQPMTREQFLLQRLQGWTQRIEGNPQDPELYLERALTYIAMQEYMQARVDLQRFTQLVTHADKHLFYMMCWWGWRYCHYGLFDGGESLMLPAADLLPQFSDVQLGPYGQFHPISNLVSLYEKYDKPELVEKWRARLRTDSEPNQ